ncbi:hypothetical protein [Streptomyces sp. NPDC001348]
MSAPAISSPALLNLVVLDISINAKKWKAVVHDWHPKANATESLRIDWMAEVCARRQEKMAGGAVCASIPGNYACRVIQTGDLKNGDHIIRWQEMPRGGVVVLVCVLPPGWVIQPGDAKLTPAGSKSHGGRFAAYWILEPTGTAIDHWWRASSSRRPNPRARELKAEMHEAAFTLDSSIPQQIKDQASDLGIITEHTSEDSEDT